MDTTTADPKQTQRLARKATDGPSPAGGKLNFNPLHPSMELPPEQLIRLLGLENKTKRRRKRPEPAAARARENRSTGTAAANKPAKLSSLKTPPANSERERDMASTPFGGSRLRLLTPPLIVGAIAGIAISAYLFWGNPDDGITTAVQAVPASTIDKKTRPSANTAKIAPTPATTPTPLKTPRQGTVNRLKAIPPNEIVVEEKRLESEAEQRFSERMTEQDDHDKLQAPDPVMAQSAETEADTPALADAPTPTPATPGDEPLDTVTSPELAVQEFQTPAPDNEALNEAPPVEAGTELDLAPVAPAETDVVQDSVAEEFVGEELF